MAAPMIFAALAKMAISATVKQALTEAVQKVEVSKGPMSRDATIAVVDMATELANNPAFQNATNNERPVQSRVTVGGAQGLVGALAFLLPGILSYFGYQVSEAYLLQVFGAIMAVYGSVYTLWGRWAPGLRPLFDTTWGKVMGLLGVGSVLAGIVLIIVLILT